ncbi:MAG: hypothetical protein AAF937_04745 [Planctomycetota bacterium]
MPELNYTGLTDTEDAALRKKIAVESVEGLPPSAGIRRYRGLSVVMGVAFLGVAAGAVGYGVMGVYGAAVASVLVLGCLLAASPVLAAAVARSRDEMNASQRG